jgi:ataxia telangiectasia mutated family protein
MKLATARTKLQKATFDSPQMLEVFREILDNLKPVMRHYFFEHQKIPSRWFEMRLNYARSVASTSIIGHILGLGDRHTSNILIDSGKGEIIPIDLGIAFDSVSRCKILSSSYVLRSFVSLKGKYLGIPERVPFRLTRDMVDGLGMTGVEGVFRKCSEHILRVLREQSDVIVTVVEVLKYDPLHTW